MSKRVLVFEHCDFTNDTDTMAFNEVSLIFKGIYRLMCTFMSIFHVFHPVVYVFIQICAH